MTISKAVKGKMTELPIYSEVSRVVLILMLSAFPFQIAEHDRDMTLVTQILWGRTTHVSIAPRRGRVGTVNVG